MADDYDYCAGGDEIDYNDYDDDYGQNNAGDIDYESMLYEAEDTMKHNLEEAIRKFNEIIELEKDNSTDNCKYSFKSYEKLVLITVKQKNYDEFTKYFQKLFELYGKIDDVDKMDTIRSICNELHDLKDDEFGLNVYRKMLDTLKEKEVEREVMNTGIQYAKTLFSLGKTDDLGATLEELLDYLDSNFRNEDEITKSIKLELLVLKIQFCNIKKLTKESKRLYIEANKLNENKVISDNRLSAIINEEGGKLYMSQKEYDQALENFKAAFYNYQAAGNIRAKNLLKYAILTSIISRTRKNIVSPEEAKHYVGDQQLDSMLLLQSAFEENNIKMVNKIWNEKISKIEDDHFIIENLNEILHNIRFNYICAKLKAYKVCKFDTLMRELEIGEFELSSLLFEIVLSGAVNARINKIKNNIQILENSTDKENTLKNLNSWLGYLNNQ